MSLTRAWVAVTLGVALLAASPALAQDAREQEARALFEAAQVAYGDGRFADAEGYFRRSYELSGRHVLLYNVGLSAEQARHDQAALEAYEQFIELVPDSAHVPRARNRIAALREILSRAGADETAEDPSDSSESASTADASADPATSDDGARNEPASSGGSAAPWIVVGTGAAAAIAGAILVGVAAADVSTVENAERGTAWADVSEAYGRSEALSIAGFVLLGVGVAAAGAGVGWALAEGGGSGEATAELRVGPGSLTLQGTF